MSIPDNYTALVSELDRQNPDWRATYGFAGAPSASFPTLASAVPTLRGYYEDASLARETADTVAEINRTRSEAKEFEAKTESLRAEREKMETKIATALAARTPSQVAYANETLVVRKQTEAIKQQTCSLFEDRKRQIGLLRLLAPMLGLSFPDDAVVALSPAFLEKFDAELRAAVDAETSSTQAKKTSRDSSAELADYLAAE